MAKNQKKRRGFGLFMLIYAVLALVGIGFGLKWLWGFISAYEASRPHIAIESYMKDLDADYVLERSGGVLELVDGNIQDPDACRQQLLEAVSGPITYARKASACTETKQVYVLRCDKQVIGSFTIVTGEADSYGFTPWVLQEESFDLSYLMGAETIRVTIPADCGITVSVNGVELDESYIVQSETAEFELLEEFYDDYELPVFTLNTYEAGPFLNAVPEVTVLDAQGNPFVYDETFDPNSLIELSDEALAGELKDFVAEFLDAYVIFAGCANNYANANYYNVIKYVVPGSTLASRMKEALDGLQYAQSRGDVIDSIVVHHLTELDEGAYMCDVTFLVNTTGREGVVQTTNNAKMVLIRTDGKLLVESMMAY